MCAGTRMGKKGEISEVYLYLPNSPRPKDFLYAPMRSQSVSEGHTSQIRSDQETELTHPHSSRKTKQLSKSLK